jgi:hypothetical protein
MLEHVYEDKVQSVEVYTENIMTHQLLMSCIERCIEGYWDGSQTSRTSQTSSIIVGCRRHYEGRGKGCKICTEE